MDKENDENSNKEAADTGESKEQSETETENAFTGQNQEENLSETEILQKSLDEALKQSAQYYDQILRLKADFENYRKRAEKEKRDFLEWGKEKILLKQIGINDVLEQALKSAKNGDNLESILIGLEMISKEFSKMLSEEGIEEIKCEKFDPQFCEALDFAEEKEKQDGEILEIYQKGYKMNGRLIRAAKVKIVRNTK